jgi:hypothetical protein
MALTPMALTKTDSKVRTNAGRKTRRKTGIRSKAGQKADPAPGMPPAVRLAPWEAAE